MLHKNRLVGISLFHWNVNSTIEILQRKSLPTTKKKKEKIVVSILLSYTNTQSNETKLGILFINHYSMPELCNPRILD